MHIFILAPAIFLLIEALRRLVVRHTLLFESIPLTQVQILIQRARSPLSCVPGPWYSKWTSLVLTYHWLRGQRAQYVQRLHERYGLYIPAHALYPNEPKLTVIYRQNSTPQSARSGFLLHIRSEADPLVQSTVPQGPNVRRFPQ